LIFCRECIIIPARIFPKIFRPEILRNLWQRGSKALNALNEKKTLKALNGNNLVNRKNESLAQKPQSDNINQNHNDETR